MIRLGLLAGIASSIVYIAADFIAAAAFPEYHSFRTRAISEFVAAGAPSRTLISGVLTIYNVLLLAFGVAVFMASRGNRALRITGSLLVALAALNAAAPLVAMPMRGEGSPFLHEVFTALTVLLILAAIGASSAAFDRRFRTYAFVTMAVMFVFGVLTGVDASSEPTPWIGILERISIGAYLLWQIVLARRLLAGIAREHRPAAR